MREKGLTQGAVCGDDHFPTIEIRGNAGPDLRHGHLSIGIAVLSLLALTRSIADFTTLATRSCRRLGSFWRGVADAL